MSSDNRAAQLATRLAFFVAGFGIACWAPLVPFAKQRLAVDDATLGLLLLSLGVGSVASMLAAGVLSARYGSKPVVMVSGFALALLLPPLTVATTPLTLALALFAFGAALGSLDVSVNIQAIEVERLSDRPLMSGFHAQFSIGGFAGSGVMTALLAFEIAPLPGTLACAALALAAMMLAAPRLLAGKPAQSGPLLVLPHGAVLLLAALAAIMFLVEGAMLDWSALLLSGSGRLPAAQAGLGYIMFSIAMTAGRLAGDAVVARIGDRATLLWGSGLAITGFVVLLAVPSVIAALVGFALIGLGASNLVPVLFRRSGAQTVMPVGLAVAAVTTAGYSGVLLGPAGIGFVAAATSLTAAFWGLAALLVIVLASAPLVARAPQ
ncbi:putative transport protein (permease) [Bradyrhizobium sp. ORS 285]|uniref:MFS transporter n=1 Tax=Bradyrhizobium sp. ORS 285 TaxID=115808 RepID=UPI00024094FD|nr:MFS transporter [Bradyrhizobium sp. ORS 285]CCD87498.1 putative transport protein (permease) [Bradyrhizobium sp. ORS 285]SMX60349.1 putative transport protein (permease) [Bradyrhizobium sp. ORS 285]